jgi:hypothetical protein
MRRYLHGLAAIILVGVSSAQAGFVVGTNGDTNANGGYGVGFSFAQDVNLIIGQEFTLNSGVVADSITVYLNGTGVGQFQLQLMGLIGPTATAANVFFSDVGTFPNTPSGGHLGVTFSGLGLPLSAGTYYLVVSSAAGPGTGWGTGADIVPSALGTIGSSFVGIAFGGAVANYTDFDPGSPNSSYTNFHINDIRGVPEPSSIALMLSGSVSLFVLRAMKRKKG